MKIIKRDGRAVDYNREKIAIAIEKANKEVKAKERVTKEEIRRINTCSYKKFTNEKQFEFNKTYSF